MHSPLELFLDELEDLTKKTGIGIGGCGDCRSPWVTGSGVDRVEDLEWEHEGGYYFVRVGRDIVSSKSGR